MTSRSRITERLVRRKEDWEAMLPGVGNLAELIKGRFGYCQIEDDIRTVPLSPPIQTKKDLLGQSKSKRKS